VTATARDQNSVRTLLEQLKKAASFSTGLVVTVVPRGDLQVAQPSNVADGLLKSYANGFSIEDRLSWQTIVKRKPLKASDVYSRADLEKSPYTKELLAPLGLKYALGLPLAGPVLDGYPGAAHVLRTADEGDFTGKEVEALLGVARAFDERRQAAHAKLDDSPESVHFAILDAKLKAQLNAAGLSALDSHLRDQMLNRAKRQMHQMNGSMASVDRVQLPDSHGDVSVYRMLSFKKFPALGDGTYTLICRQPGCLDWGAVKPQDFQADAELSRLIPALKFMQKEYSRGPTLNEIAAVVHLSPFHFHRRFAELLGLTPKQYLLECQIHKCKNDLLDSEKELATIAKECGFAHQSHFTSRFKQTTGLTPTRWRRMMAEKQSSN
jgi:AraC-like DNA-binding protein